MLALLDDPIGQVDLPGLSASPVDVPVSTTRFELVLNLEESEAGLRGALEYSTICSILKRPTAWSVICSRCSGQSPRTRGASVLESLF